MNQPLLYEIIAYNSSLIVNLYMYDVQHAFQLPLFRFSHFCHAHYTVFVVDNRRSDNPDAGKKLPLHYVDVTRRTKQNFEKKIKQKNGQRTGWWCGERFESAIYVKNWHSALLCWSIVFFFIYQNVSSFSFQRARCIREEWITRGRAVVTYELQRIRGRCDALNESLNKWSESPTDRTIKNRRPQ